MPPGDEARLREIPAPLDAETFDVVYRIGFPLDLRPSPRASRTVAFIACEAGGLGPSEVAGNIPLAQAHRDGNAIIVTPSQWSRRGLLNSGADPQRVKVIPHGVDGSLFQPLPPERKAQLRQRLGISDFTFFFTGSAMTPNKGTDLLLKAAAIVAQTHPQLRLLVKGVDALYRARDFFGSAVRLLTQAELNRLQTRLRYEGVTMTFAQLAQIYQAADAYVSPYRAEGYNMPVLEAIASGLPVICTRGGSTDDFTADEFALRIDSTQVPLPGPDAVGRYVLQPNLDHLVSLMKQVMDDPTIGARARQAGPAFAATNFTWRRVVDQLLEVCCPPNSGT
jgi:glycosyltransferase involved in cell wall biosynthesis